jgi:hypothetical protein
MTGPLERLVERCLCGGCPACGVPDYEPTDEDLEDQAARQIDAEEAASC